MICGGGRVYSGAVLCMHGEKVCENTLRHEHIEYREQYLKDLYLRVLPKGNAKLAHFLRGGVEQLFVARSRLPPLVLLLQGVADDLQGLVGAHGEWVCTQDTSAFEHA